MFVNESIDDILKAKTQKQIRSDFKNQFGISYSDLEKTLKRLHDKDISAKIEHFSIPGMGEADAIAIAPWEVKRSSNGHQWEIIATVVTQKIANEIVDFLKPRLDIGARNEFQYKVQQSYYEIYVSNTDALKILSKLKK
ncbi:MAG: hypothetical protein GYA51_05685 [Candidatus Methanofastidiosa archaeon]|nr:hypothetical protein [Candidatus Methanofastidiosa archaeon]